MTDKEDLWFDPIQRSKLDQFELLQVIGVGAFSVVRLARHRPTNMYYAMKIVSKHQVIGQGILEDVMNEKHILESIDHPYIVKLYRTFQDADNLYFLMEYIVGGEITLHGTRFRSDVVAGWAAELVLVFHYLHMRGIVYKDLKPENILLDSTGHIKLTDFGLAKCIEGDGNVFRRPRQDALQTPTTGSVKISGTVEYLSPQAITSGGYAIEDDWWSLGVLIFELLAGYQPFRSNVPWDDDTEASYLASISHVETAIRARKLKFPSHFTPIEIDFILRLLDVDPDKRIGISECVTGEIYSHPFFRNVDFAELLLGYGNAPASLGFSSLTLTDIVLRNRNRDKDKDKDKDGNKGMQGNGESSDNGKDYDNNNTNKNFPTTPTLTARPVLPANQDEPMSPLLRSPPGARAEGVLVAWTADGTVTSQSATSASSREGMLHSARYVPKALVDRADPARPYRDVPLPPHVFDAF